MNTDVTDYGGSGIGNYGSVQAVPEPWHGRPASAVLTIPPLATLWLVHDPEPERPPAANRPKSDTKPV
jgi:1,4-alpha-glucan branching enzyme